MPDVPDWTIVQWVTAGGGLWASGFAAGLVRAYFRRIVSAS